MRETNDGRLSPVKLTSDFDGVTKATAVNRMLEAYHAEYYRNLGQTLPRGRWFSQGRRLISPFAEAVRIPYVQRVLEVLIIVVMLMPASAWAQGTIKWSGTPQSPSEAAAILLNAPGKSNFSERMAPLPEGVIGEPLPGSPIIYYWRWYGDVRLHGVGQGFYRAGSRHGRNGRNGRHN